MRAVETDAFPDHQRPKTSFSEHPKRFSIAGPIRAKFRLPKFTIAFRRGRSLAAAMPVPETTVHEYRDLLRSVCEVWGAREVPILLCQAQAD
jgi:hypothetical protein